MRAQRPPVLAIAAFLCVGMAKSELTRNYAPSAKADVGKRTLVGVVSDAMCGANHMMADDAQCVHACVAQQGSKYALVVGQKMYTLQGHRDDLDKLADKKVSVTGTVSGDVIDVMRVREIRPRSSP
jgi:hypothetical protein